MTFDAIRLQSWYNTAQGQTVVRLVGGVMERWVQPLPAKETLGLGYSQPYLDYLAPLLGKCLGAAPAEMGVSRWPLAKDNRIAQVRPDALPFPDQHFNRVIMVHLLEGADYRQEIFS